MVPELTKINGNAWAVTSGYFRQLTGAYIAFKYLRSFHILSLIQVN